MYTCPNCNHSSETPMNFCAKCGTQTVYTAPAPQAPAYEAPQAPAYEAPQPQYQEPIYAQPMPVNPNAPSKGKVITGMAFGIAGFALAILGFIYTLAFWDVDEGAAFGMAIGFFMFSFPASLVGLILSSKNRNAGDDSTMSKLGKIFGLIGVILSGVSILLGIIALATYEPPRYYDYYNDYNNYNYYY